MSIHYLDASAWVKRYIGKEGSQRMSTWMNQNPLDAGGGVVLLCSLAESVGRFDGDYFVILVGKPGGIAAGSGTDIQNEELSRWQKRKPVGVDLVRVDLLISREKNRRPAACKQTWSWPRQFKAISLEGASRSNRPH